VARSRRIVTHGGDCVAVEHGAERHIIDNRQRGPSVVPISVYLWPDRAMSGQHLRRKLDAVLEAAVATYNATGEEPLMTPKAVHLLSVMFADADICQRNFDSLMRDVIAG